MIFIKMIVSGDGWGVWDVGRDTNNPRKFITQWSSGSATTGTEYDVDFLASGFKVRDSNAQLNHTSYDPYIWGAWGDVSFKYNNT